MNGTDIALTNLGNDLYKGIVSEMFNQNRVATGKTVNDIDVVVEGPERMYITGPAYLVNLEKGRGPTSPTGPYQRYGGLSFRESLALWMQARGIDQGKKEGSTQEFGPVLWAIYTKINKLGYTGTPGVLSKPLGAEVVNKALDDNLGPLANLYAQQVLKELFK